MPLLSVLASLLEFLVTSLLAVVVVYLTLRALIRTNTDFDEDDQLLRGNVAVGLLVAALLLGSASMMHKAFEPAADLLRSWFSSAQARQFGILKLALYTLGDLALSFGVTVMTMSLSLRLFGRLTRTEKMRAGAELEKGNLAVGILLASVVFIVALFVGDGLAAVSKAVLPAPRAGMLRIMR
ncbi:MAG: DUF350 domain-containing protein [Elusimicrobiota bacterium]|jgi:uncharacterized membrane protein YjfL (UPF0719 family)